MVNTNVVGGSDGVSYQQGWSNQSQVFIESFSNQSSNVVTLQNPATFSLIAWNYPNIQAAAASATLTSGVVYVLKVPLTGSLITVTNVLAAVATAGSSLTAAQCFAGLYDNNGVKVASSADQSGVWTSVGLKTMVLGSGPFIGEWPFVSIVIITNGTTNPQFARASGAGVGASIANLSTTGVNVPFATNGTGATSLPASLTYSSNSGSANNPQSIWVGLS